MTRRASALPLVAVTFAMVCATVSARAQERTWIGAGGGVQNLSKAMLGGAPEIVDGLNLYHDDRSTVRWVPQVTVGIDLHDTRDTSFGIDLVGSWYADSIDGTNNVRIRVLARRDVIPLSVLARLAVGGHESRFVFAAGPILALSRFEERGWLGDGVQTKPALGVAFTLGGRTEGSSSIRVSYLVFVQGLHLPTRNPLLQDGGGTWMGGATLGIDFGI